MKEFKKLIDCLNRQVCELETLCRLKDNRIQMLEKKISELEVKKPSWNLESWQAEEVCQQQCVDGTISGSCGKCQQIEPIDEEGAGSVKWR